MGKRIYPVSTSFFSVIDTEEKAYALGLMYSDGCVCNNYISFSQCESNKDIVYLLKYILSFDGPVRVKKFDSCQTQYIISFRSEEMFNDLGKLGVIPNKSLKLKFPTFLKHDLYRHFIRGVFDGDGSVYNGEEYIGLCKRAEGVYRPKENT